jgi:hypothetical protein
MAEIMVQVNQEGEIQNRNEEPKRSEMKSLIHISLDMQTTGMA